MVAVPRLYHGLTNFSSNKYKRDQSQTNKEIVRQKQKILAVTVNTNVSKRGSYLLPFGLLGEATPDLPRE